MYEAIGAIELSSISRGFEVTDAMLKTADITLILSRTICSGKYLAIIAGDVGEVESAIVAGKDKAAHSCIDSLIIANVHPGVFPAFRGLADISPGQALGVVEAFSVCSCLEAADGAVKAAQVELLEIRLAMALGGKAFFTLTGSVSDVTAAVDQARALLSENGMLVDGVVIAGPKPQVFQEII